MDSADDNLREILASLDPALRTLVAEADLGIQAKEFASSDLGRHFIGCAMQEIMDAQQQLSTVLPWRRRKIQELQNRIWRAQFLLSWLRELLLSGKSAEGAIAEVEN